MSQISQYENYKTESGTPYSAEEQATFESTGVVPVSGKYHDGDTSMVTKSINLNDIISSGFPEHTQLDAGKVLGVKNDGTLEWVEKLPAHDHLDKDKVLTVTGSHGDTVEWVTPSGGGGGGGNIVIAKVILQEVEDEVEEGEDPTTSLHFVSGTHTVKQLYDLINAGETVVNVHLSILNSGGFTKEIHMLTSGSTRDGEDYNVYMTGAGGSGSYTPNETAELLGWWNDGEDAGEWKSLNTTSIITAAAE